MDKVHKYTIYIYMWGPDNSSGIATSYGLDGPDSMPDMGKDFIFSSAFKRLWGPEELLYKGFRGRLLCW